MGTIATPAVPSTTNIIGGIAGLISTMAVGYLTSAGYLTIAATAIGVPQATLIVLVTGIIGAVANVAVTHVAELKEADDFIKSLQSIKTEASYPNDPVASTTTNNINKG